MKGIRRKRKTQFLSALLLIIFFASSYNLTTEAGIVEKSNSFVGTDGKLNITDWFDPEDSLYIENGKLIIPNESTSDTRIISKTLGEKDSAYQNMVVLSGEYRFTQLPQDEKFILGLGLDSVESYSGEPGNIEVEFVNKGRVAVRVVAYDENGEETVLATEKSTGISVGQTMKVVVTATTDSKINVEINGKNVCSVETTEDMEGRVGFLQTGNCGVEISNFTADFTHYDRPENANASENFETEVYDENLFSFNFMSNSRLPGYVNVEEYEGSNVLMFYNTRLCYFGTKYPYSNFEMTFDVPYYLRERIEDENDKTLNAPTQEFLVSLGDDAQRFTDWGYATSAEAIRFSQTEVYGMNHNPAKFRVTYSGKGYFNPETNEGFSVMLKMVDGHLTVGMKSLDATKFDILAEADYEDFRTGYIKIWSVNDGNFAIDNVKITNLDAEPNLTEVEFEGALIEQKDFNYEPPELVFREQEAAQEETEESYWPMVIGITALSCFVILGVCVVISIILKKKNSVKGEVKNEIQ